MTEILGWFETRPVVGCLIVAMSIDVAMGLLLAFGSKTVNSSVSRVGMVRKVATMLLVALGFVIEPFAHGVPAGTLTASAFLVSESLSVMENAALLGLPVPSVLTDALSKLRGEKAPPITLKLTSDASNRVEQGLADAAQAASNGQSSQD